MDGVLKIKNVNVILITMVKLVNIKNASHMEVIVNHVTTLNVFHVI